MIKIVTSLACVTLVSACASLLPATRTDASSFQTFEEARDAVVALVPMKSSRKAGEKNGFDFAKHPNTKILTHSDLVLLLVPAGLLKREDLDPGILVCMEARDACNGLGRGQGDGYVALGRADDLQPRRLAPGTNLGGLLLQVTVHPRIDGILVGLGEHDTPYPHVDDGDPQARQAGTPRKVGLGRR